ncbi:InlB B-repeat-containing protein [Paenibacillus vini]|uniref:Repeat protein (TIGR02543 family) n=1 Tax=Paenibacillus vini TaxID=1476024 RepID=A0ABQ4MDK3_9BACL|nr:InlB B-repeat-containing protein [Paenibacillus vini]GIP54062.1 hypothetical protein J42TS3_30970 [Paenibacillus vini]
MLQRRQLFIPVLLFFVLFSWLSPQASAATIDFGTARVDVETNDVQDGYAPLKPVPLGDDLLLYWQDYTTGIDYQTLIHPDGSFSSLPAPTISPRTNNQSDTIVYEGLSNGNILVYWYSGSSGTGLTDTYFKIINQNGTEVVGATKINSSPGSLNRFTKVAELSNGNLAFVWATDGSNYALRRFQPNGTPVDAAQLSVTSLAGISGSQYTHDIAAQKNGKFMIMIAYYNPNYVGMIFNNDSPTPIQVNGQNSFVISNRGENGDEAQWLKAMPNGRFLAVYRKKTGGDTSSRSAVYQIFNSDGTVYKAETLIRNLNSWGGISEPVLLPEGGYLLGTSYLDYNTEPDTYHSYLEIYDDSGVLQGDASPSLPVLNDEYGTSIPFLDVDGKLSLLINDKEPNRATYDVWLLRHSQAASYEVTFEDWDGTVLKTETVNRGEDATAPAAPSRTGYTFTGWDVGFTNVTSALTVKAQYKVNQYTVSFDSNAGSLVTAITADFGSKIVAPAQPTLEGFTFAGWYKDEALTQVWNFATDTVPLNGITLYAKWNINVYQVTFEDWDGDVLKTEPVNHGANATAPASPSRPGYTFTGWDKGFSNVIGALTVKAQYEANQYSVSFDSNGGSPVASITAEFDSLIVAPTEPTLEGFTFAGWYKDEALTQVWDFATDTVPLNGITLYAKWNINVYQVTFEDWDGDVLKTEPVNHGATATAPAPPSRPGYTFTGWDKGFTNVTGALTVKAQYEANQYTVSFDSNGGSPVASVTADFDSLIVAPTEPTLEGYTFDGWYKDEALTQSWNFTTDTVPLDGITLYAKWNINVYQVTFEDWDGTVLKTEPVNHGADATAPASPSRPGYTFTGWDKGFSNVTGALTVRAQYEANQYTVSFDSNGGSLVTPITADFDSLIVAPAEPTLEGFTFAGWYKDEALTQSWNFATDTVPLDGITLYAKWTIQLPSVPSNLRVTTGDGQVTLNWDSASGATYYDVYMSTTPGLTGKTSIATVTEATYQVSDLSNGTTYYFVVKAGNAGGLSAESNEVNATPQIPAPGAPVLQQAIGGNAKVQLSWSPVLGSTGYQIYQSTESGIYGSETATVTESVYSYEVDGLANGKVYYFVVKAINEGGLSAESNEMSAKPATVPSAPRDVTAVAGNGQATITFTSPADNGGSSITRYEVTSSPGNIVATGVGSPIVITGLSNGTSYFFTVKAINEQGGSESSASSNTVTPFVSSGNNDPGSYSPPAQTTPSNPAVTTENKNVNILVNGKVENIGTQSLDVVNGQQVTTIQVDEAEFQKRLETAGNGAVITIPFDGESDIVIAELNGRMLKNMEDKQATVEVRTNGAVYTLPVQRIDIQSLAKQFGSNLEIQDIMLQVEIGIPSKESIQTAEKAASAQGLQMIVSPWNFSVKAVYGGRTLEVTKFDFFVERSIAIPNSVDPNKVTTGVVVDPDGSIRHVPTKVINQEGTYYAQINSLTNSMYSVVWHPVEFADVENHWAKDAVNDMGSRMVINGTGNGMFDPDRDITRAEFASIIVRSLGLKQENAPESATFSDVFTSDWFNGAINTASAYQLINGFDDSSFRPNDKITREQAMEIISKAMKITGLETKGSTLDSDSTLRPFADSEDVSHWAMNGVTASVQAGIVSGRSVNELAPKSFITRAEVSMIVQRLLQKSDLI